METIRALIFDLDYTLYPSECNTEALCNKKIKRYLIKKLNCRTDEFSELRRQLIEEYGDFMTGVFEKYGFDRGEFVDCVCNIDVSLIPANPELNSLLKKVKLPKYIYTDSTRQHVKDTLQRLELKADFADILDIYDAGFLLKRCPGAYERILAKINYRPGEILLFEDNPKNIAAAKKIGIKTVGIGEKKNDADCHFATINLALRTIFNL